MNYQVGEYQIKYPKTNEYFYIILPERSNHKVTKTVLDLIFPSGEVSYRKLMWFTVRHSTIVLGPWPAFVLDPAQGLFSKEVIVLFSLKKYKGLFS